MHGKRRSRDTRGWMDRCIRFSEFGDKGAWSTYLIYTADLFGVEFKWLFEFQIPRYLLFLFTGVGGVFLAEFVVHWHEDSDEIGLLFEESVFFLCDFFELIWHNFEVVDQFEGNFIIAPLYNFIRFIIWLFLVATCLACHWGWSHLWWIWSGFKLP